jgi:hypothetical protein
MSLPLGDNLSCLNCKHPLSEGFHYCPNCGQENSAKLVSFGTLVFEMISNFLSYDSRFVQTLFPFLFKPGFLTNEFIAGRRIRYTHPLRLYIFVSVVYFSVVSLMINKSDPTKKNEINLSTNFTGVEVNSLKDSIVKDIRTDLQEAQSSKPDAALQGKGQAKEQKKAKEKDIPDIGGGELNAYIGYINQDSITEDQILDSLHWEKNAFNRFKVHQGMRIAHLKKDEFVAFYLGKLSLMMFVMLPFVALFLKLLYIRRKRFYMEHLTFLLHIHAFVFLILSIAFLCDYYRDKEEFSDWAYLLLAIYTFVAFKRVYLQGWFKTLSKIFLFLITYSVCLGLFMVATLLVSALLY